MYLVKCGGSDLAQLLVYFRVSSQAFAQHQAHISGLGQLAALVLGQVAEDRDGIWFGGGIDDFLKRLDGLGKLEEQGDGGVATGGQTRI